MTNTTRAARDDIDRLSRDMGRVTDLHDLIRDVQALRQRLETDLTRLKTIEKTLTGVAASIFNEWGPGA